MGATDEGVGDELAAGLGLGDGLEPLDELAAFVELPEEDDVPDVVELADVAIQFNDPVSQPWETPPKVTKATILKH